MTCGRQKRLFYNGDVMHCNNSLCKLKETCYRYWLSRHADGIVSVYRPKDNLERDTCEFYVDIKK